MYLGIDIGTTSVKVLLLAKTGEIIDTYSGNYPCYYPQKGFSEQNPEDWWNQTKQIIRKIPNRKNIKAISFSGQMHGLVLLDKSDKVIRPAILWNDQRTEKETEYLNSAIGKDNLVKWTSNIAFSGFTAPKVLWVKNNEPKNFKRIHKVLLPKDYIAFRFSSEYATDVSDASGTLYFNVEKKEYSHEMLDIIGLKESQLPSVYESNEVIGKINPDVAIELGLDMNAMIVIGGGDQAVGAVGTGCISEGDVNISLGTSGVVFACLDNYKISTNNTIHNFAHANNHYFYMGVILSATKSLNWWLKDILDVEYKLILNQISIDKVDSNLIYLPYLMGERSPINNEKAKGVFFGLTNTTTGRSMTKAVLEGVGFALKQNLDIIHNEITDFDSIQITGGGSNSEDWVQIIADILQEDIKVLSTSEGPALGAAFLAKSGFEHQPLLGFVKNSLAISKVIYHNESMSNIYNEKYKKYLELYKAICHLY